MYVAGDDGVIVGPWNVISGNAGHGVYIEGGGPDDSQILGNLIGTDRTATAALPNSGNGIDAFGGATFV